MQMREGAEIAGVKVNREREERGWLLGDEEEGGEGGGDGGVWRGGG